MKTYRAFIMVTVLALGLQAYGGNTIFQIDPVHSALNFEIRHVFSTFVGRFNNFSGTIVADMEKETLVSVSAEVDVLSLDTANKDRDKHLLNKDFLKADKFSKAVFKSSSIKKGKKGKGRVTGNITIAGVTKEVTFEGRFLGYGEDFKKGHRAGFHAEAVIKKEDFGIIYSHPLPNGQETLGSEVKLVLNIEAIETKKPIELKPLADTIKAFKDKNKKELPPEVKAALKKANEEIMKQGDIGGLKIGDKAPDFKLPDDTGKKIRLSRELKKGPVVLVFYRGEWCPFCNLQLRALGDVYPEIQKLGASLLAIAPQQEKNAANQQQENNLGFPLLSDTKGDTMREYKLLYKVPDEMKKVYMETYGIDLEKYNGDGRWELPVTATYIIGKDGTIKAGLVDHDYTKRMEPADILKALGK